MNSEDAVKALKDKSKGLVVADNLVVTLNLAKQEVRNEIVKAASKEFQAGAKASSENRSCTENPHKSSVTPYDKVEIHKYKEWLDGWLHYKNPKYIGE